MREREKTRKKLNTNNDLCFHLTPFKFLTLSFPIKHPLLHSHSIQNIFAFSFLLQYLSDQTSLSQHNRALPHHSSIASSSPLKMESVAACENDLNLKATELRLGLPGTDEMEEQTLSSARNKRPSPDTGDDCGAKGNSDADCEEVAPVAKAQIVGWPPIRSYRKNNLQPNKTETEGAGIYVKVSMDGAPYLRKIDLKLYAGYSELLKALENMFKFTIGQYSEREGYKGSEFAPTYEDKDGDWMLVGDVPWEMFMSSCKRLRIMKGSEARGLQGCGA